MPSSAWSLQDANILAGAHAQELLALYELDSRQLASMKG